jgi:hypothetical protein
MFICIQTVELVLNRISKLATTTTIHRRDEKKISALHTHYVTTLLDGVLQRVYF